MPKVSLYNNIKETKNATNLEITEIYDRIKCGFWDKEVNPVIVAVRNNSPEPTIAELKNKVPYFTGSGTFKSRNENGLEQHSGKIVIDFDKVDKIMPFAEAIELLINDKYSECVFKSISGRGIAVIVNIDTTKHSHREYFLFLQKYYQECYGLPLDIACKDISRPRFISSDPNLFYNPYPEIVDLPETTNSITVDTNEEKYNWVLKIHDKKHQFVEGLRHRYILILAGFLNKCGVDYSYALNSIINQFGNQEFDGDEITKIVKWIYNNLNDHGTFTINKSVSQLPQEFSKDIKQIYSLAHGANRAGRKYTNLDITSACNQYNLSSEIVESIFKNVLEKNEDEFGFDDKPEIYKVELYIKKNYEIIRNTVTTRIEYKIRNSTDPFVILSADSIYRNLQHENFRFSLDKLKSLLRSNYVENYNPFIEYFSSLPEWDGVDYITELANHIQTDNQEFWLTQFKKALIRSIACSVGLRENRIVMTLVGKKQETGKSTFLRFLCPPSLKDYYSESGMGNEKDVALQLAENFIWNLEELAALHNNEINKLKSIISQNKIKERRSYAEFHESHPRRVNFWASTNQNDFLTDDQNTRWLCFNVIGINHDYNNLDSGISKINIDNVWSQAYAMYLAGEKYILTAEESLLRDEGNQNYEKITFEKQVIQQYLRPAKSDEINVMFLNASQILMKINELTDNKYSNRLNLNNIGKCLHQLGFTQMMKKVNKKPMRCYYVMEKFTMLGSTINMHDDDDDDVELEKKPKPF